MSWIIPTLTVVTFTNISLLNLFFNLLSVIFNEKNAFLKYIKLNKDDDYVAEKVWTEIGQACDNTWKDLHRNTLLAADE